MTSGTDKLLGTELEKFLKDKGVKTMVIVGSAAFRGFEVGGPGGRNVRRYNLIYLASIAIIVALGVDLVGGLMTAALVAIPASSGRNISRKLTQFTFASTAFGVGSAIIGIVASTLSGLPAGPLVIITSAIIFLITVAAAKH